MLLSECQHPCAVSTDILINKLLDIRYQVLKHGSQNGQSVCTNPYIDTIKSIIAQTTALTAETVHSLGFWILDGF